MYRLLIVDDERHIVRWLCDLFASLEGVELDIYRAYSGEEALGVLARTNIDVVLCDYRMPGMSGLELLDKVKANWKDRRVILLSAYDTFDYVYKAGAHGAVRYILKTEDDDVIVQAVVDAMASIEKERAEAAILDRTRFADGLLRYVDCCESIKCFLRSGTVTPDFPFDAGLPVQPVVGGPARPADRRRSPVELKTRYSLQLLSERCFSEYARCALIESEGNCTLWILQGLGGNQQPTPLPPLPFLCQLFEKLQALVVRSLSFGVSFVLHNRAVPWTEMPPVAGSLARRIALRTGDPEGGEPLITFAPDGPPAEAPGDQLLVGRIRRFVKANLGGDLSLTNISRNVYYNPSYISRVFKRATGTNVANYIAGERIDRAVHLLTATGMSIQDVAHECGFDSPQYFSTVFRKATGCAPHAYRERKRDQDLERK